jgi:signal transduction histidine kinase
VEHLTRLVDDLLDVSRVNRGLVKLEMVPLELRTVVANAVEQVHPLIQHRGHHLMLDLAPGAARVSGDSERLVQVVANLLANAAKYTPEGGHLRLAVQTHQQQVVLTVQDNGIGLAADLIPHIFDLFIQADRSIDRSSGGLGLGVWAAEGFENWTENFDLPEQLTPRYFGEGKGSGTPENITF